MSSFDKRVCLWLNTASINDKSKIATLNRMNVGINNYRNLGLEPAAGTSAAKAEPSVRVDYTLQDSIAKAVNRLKDRQKKVEEEAAKDEKSRAEVPPLKQPLFPTITRETFAARSGGLTPRSSRPITPRGGGGGGAAASTAAASTAATNGSSSSAAAPSSGSAAAPPPAAFAGFTFGEPPADSDHQANPASDDVEDDVMPAHEDEARRRLTIAKRQSRHAISAEIIDPETAARFEGETVPKSSEITERVVKALETHHLFSFLDDSDLRRVVDIMKVRSFKRGEVVVEADKPNDTFFVVVTGSLAVEGAASSAAAATGPSSTSDTSAAAASSSGRINVGGTLGEHGLMYESKAPQTVTAAVATTQCCTIDRSTYKTICSKVSTIKRERYEGFLSRVPFLRGLTRTEKLQLADALKGAKYNKGDFLIRHGEEGVWFNIIVEGTVDVIGRDAEGKEIYVCSFGEGDCVGELEFLFKHKTVADVVAKSDVVRTAKMTASHFEKVIGSAKEVLERQAEADGVYAYYRNIQGVAHNNSSNK